MAYKSALVPTPFWSQQTVDSSPDGILAYGSFNSIVLIDIRTTPILHTIFTAHREKRRVVSLSCCKMKNAYLVASLSDEGVLKVFDIKNTPTCDWVVADLKNASAVEWKHGSKSTLFYSHEFIIITQVDVDSKSKKHFTLPQKYPVTVMVSCPTDPCILAIGHKNGVVTLFSVSIFKVIKQLDLCNEEVIGLSWSPFSSTQLLSYGYHGKICISSSIDEEPKIKIFKPCSRSSRRFDGASKPTVAIWHPKEQDCIIFCNDCNISEWKTNSEDQAEIVNYDSQTAIHTKQAFALCVSEYDTNVIYSMSIDRQIIFWDVTKKKGLFSLPTLGGEIYALAIAPTDYSRLAIACADGYMRIWNTASSNEYDVDYFYQKTTKGKITCLAWHPQKENILAIGMADGSVGYMGTISSKKTVTSFASKHSDTVYSLAWGPVSKAQEDYVELALFSCGNGEILIQTLRPNEKKALKLKDLLPKASDSDNRTKGPFCTEVAWKPDFTLLAVGHNDGHIAIYDGKSFALLASVESQKKSVQCLSWHPKYTSLSGVKSPYHSWLACGSAECDVLIYDLQEISEGDHTNAPVVIQEATKRLRGHKSRIVGLVWSPHVQEALASASYDKTVMVWDILKSAAPQICFRGHFQRCFALAWSYMDPDVIFSGGADACLMKWRISDQNGCFQYEEASSGRNTLPSSEMKKKKYKVSKDIQKSTAQGVLKEGQNGAEKVETTDEVVKDRSNQDLPYEHLTFDFKNTEIFPIEQFVKDCTLHGLSPQFAKEYQNFVDTLKNNKPLTENLLRFAFLGKREHFFANLQFEMKCAQEQELHGPLLFYHMLRGSIREGMEQPCEAGKLSDLHVALAPLGSHDLWKEMVEKYSKQLENNNQYRKAANFLLLIGKKREAVQLMKQYVNPREVYGFAKAVLPESDPLIEETLISYKEKMQSHLLMASCCSIALNEPLNAASCLMRKNLAVHQKVAAYICLKFGKPEEAKKCALSCIQSALIEGNYEVAESLFSEQPGIKGFKMVVAIHKLLSDHLMDSALHSDYGIREAALFTEFPADENLQVFTCFRISGHFFIYHLVNTLQLQDCWLPESDLIESTLADLNAIIMQQGFGHTKMEVVHFIALTLSAYLLSVFSHNLKFDSHSTFLHLNNALFSAYQHANPALFNAICSLLLPFDITWDRTENHLKIELPCVTAETSEVISKLHSSYMWLYEQIYTTEPLTSFEADHLLNPDHLTSVLQRTTSADSIMAFFAINLYYQLHLELKKREAMDGIPDESADLWWKCTNSKSLDGENHQTCLSAKKVVFGVLELIKTLVCKDDFGVRTFLQNQKGLVETQLLALPETEKNHATDNVSSEAKVVNNGTVNGYAALPGDRAAGVEVAKADEMEEQKELVRHRHHLLNLSCLIDEKIIRILNGVAAADNIEALCHWLCSLVSCPEVNRNLNAIAKDINKWSSKFSMKP